MRRLSLAVLIAAPIVMAFFVIILWNQNESPEEIYLAPIDTFDQDNNVPLTYIAGAYYYHPYVIGFNMQQEYIRYSKAKNPSDKNLAKSKLVKYADWAVNTPLRNDYGNWSTWSYNFTWGDLRPGWVSGLGNAAIGKGLVYAWKVTGNETYLMTAKEAFGALAVDYRDGGLLYECSEDSWWYLEYAQWNMESSRFVLNGFMDTLISINVYEELTHDYSFHFLWERGLKCLKERIKYYDSPDLKWSQYWIGGDNPVQTHYQIFHIALLEDLYNITNDSFFLEYLEKWRKYYIVHYPFFISLYKTSSDGEVPAYALILRHSSLGPPNPYLEDEYPIRAEINITFANGSTDSFSINLEDYKRNLFNLAPTDSDNAHLPMVFVNKTIIGQVSNVSVWLYMDNARPHPLYTNESSYPYLFLTYYEPPIYEKLFLTGSEFRVDGYEDNVDVNRTIFSKAEHFGPGIVLHSLALPIEKLDGGQIRFRIESPREMHPVYETVLNFEQPESLNKINLAYDAQDIRLNSEHVAEGRFAAKIFINTSLIYDQDVNNYRSNQGRIVFTNPKINTTQYPYLFFQFRPEASFRGYAIDIYMQDGNVYSRYFSAEPFKWNKIILSWIGFGYFQPGTIDKISITVYTLGSPSGNVYIDDIRVLKSPLFVEPLAEGIFTVGNYTYVDVSRNKSTIQYVSGWSDP